MQNEHGDVISKKSIKFLVKRGAVHGDVLVPEACSIDDAKPSGRPFGAICQGGEGIIHG